MVVRARVTTEARMELRSRHWGEGSRYRRLRRKSGVPRGCAELTEVTQLLLMPGLGPKGTCRRWGTL